VGEEGEEGEGVKRKGGRKEGRKEGRRRSFKEGGKL
jgi:hypothetical protein